MQIFDEKIKFVPRRPLPEVLCIDEIKFQTDVDRKYVCILYDFHRREIVDVIISRQMPYLREYFSNINILERNKVKIVISDMYDGYSTIVSHYFKSAIHIVDMFHVIRLLTTAINVLRVRTMNLMTEKNSPEYNFMKRNWKLFLCRWSRVSIRIKKPVKCFIMTNFLNAAFNLIFRYGPLTIHFMIFLIINYDIPLMKRFYLLKELAHI